jgi:hypothetical protein
MDDELKAVIVEESKKGVKDWEEEEQAEQIKGFAYQPIKGLTVMQVPARTTVPGGCGADWCGRSQIGTEGVRSTQNRLSDQLIR